MNTGLQAVRSGLEQQSQEGWKGGIAVAEVLPCVNTRWIPAFPGGGWCLGFLRCGRGMHVAKFFSLFLYTLPHQTPSLGCFPKCESEAQKGLEWIG